MILKNKFILFLELLFLLTSISQFYSISYLFSFNNFDGQNLLAWKYTSEIGMLPYKDIFYPYGLMEYWAESKIIWGFLKSFFLFLLLNGLLYSLLYLFNKKSFAYSIFLLVFGFILLITGITAFERYGMLVVFALLLSCLFLQNKLSQTLILIIGVLSSSLFFLVTDQGTLMLFWTLFFFISSPVIKNPSSIVQRSYYLIAIKKILIFGSGVLIGSIPFVFYLLNNNILADFITHITILTDISEYAKTPYFHSLRSWEGQMNIAILFVSIFYLSFRYFFVSRTLNKKVFYIIVLTLVLLVLEQKSIIRSIDGQLTFISVLIAGILISTINIKIINSKSLSLLFGLILIILISNPTHLKYTLDVYKKNNTNAIAINMIGNDYSYLEVLNRIKKERNFNGKIFSFPGDPIYYILNNQIPPHYFTIYEGTPLYAQNNRIEYIRKNNIEYVIINTKVRAIQDDVPDYIRSPNEFAYILTHFTAVDSVDNFLILKRQLRISDFFSNKLPDNFKDFRSFLLRVNLKSIPRSEGIYKNEYLSGINSISFKNEKLLNAYLSSNKVNSANRLLVIGSKNGKKRKDIEVKIRTLDGKETKITFYACENSIPCIIHFDKIPLFYINRLIKEIKINAENINMIKLAEYKLNNRFW